jgi:hypothetical protein
MAFHHYRTEIIVKGRSFVAAAGALVLALALLEGEAGARTAVRAHTRHVPQGYAPTYAPRQAPQNQPSRSSSDIYQSDAQGHQSYPNPDRDPFGYNRYTY